MAVVNTAAQYMRSIWSGFKMALTDIKVIVAIIAITIMEVCALMHNIDGALLSTSIAIVAGLAGYSAGRKITIQLQQNKAEEKENGGD